MPNIDAYEEEILSAYEDGKLAAVATKEELAKFKAAARATAKRPMGEHTSVARRPSRPLSGK